MLRHKAASYAVAALVELSRHEHNGNSPEVAANIIAERYGRPVSYTAKILGQLAKSTLLRSGRGPRGGFALTRKPSEITLLEIFRAVGAVGDSSVPLAAEVPNSVQTNLDEVLGRAMERANRVLVDTSLADLLEGAEQTAGIGQPAGEADVSST